MSRIFSVMTPRKILGLDPGLGRTGWAVIEAAGSRLRLIEAGCCRTVPHQEPGQRLLDLHRQVLSIGRRYRPSSVAIEQLFFSSNITTAMAVSQARGVILLALAECGLVAKEFSPTAVKRAIGGYGRAGKPQLGRMVKLLLSLPKLPVTDDAVDAAAVAICGAQRSYLKE